MQRRRSDEWALSPAQSVGRLGADTLGAEITLTLRMALAFGTGQLQGDGHGIEDHLGARGCRSGLDLGLLGLSLEARVLEAQDVQSATVTSLTHLAIAPVVHHVDDRARALSAQARVRVDFTLPRGLVDHVAALRQLELLARRELVVRVHPADGPDVHETLQLGLRSFWPGGH